MALFIGSYDRKMIQRAIAAWCRKASLEGTAPDQPDSEASILAEFGGKDYVVLRNDKAEPIAVYRITNRKILKLLKQWPKQLRKSK